MVGKLNKKIVVSIATLGSGGAERVLSVLSKPLAEKFDSVTYVTWLDAPVFYPIDENVKLISIPKEIGTAKELERMRWFRKFVKSEKPDLVLSFLEPWNIRVLLSTFGLNVRTIVAERNDPQSVNGNLVVSQIEKLVYRRANRILVQTATIKKFFSGSLADRTDIIYNPVNISEEMVGKALVVPKKKRIVSVARLTAQKKHDVLIRAFAMLHQAHPGYTLTIYGNGPQKEELEQLASKLGVGGVVLMPGVSKTVHQDILDAEMFCLVSIREGMSNAMIEAMCLGLPCICSKVSGAIDLIDHGRNGLLVEIDDEDALFQGMCRVVGDKAFARSVGKEASHLYNILRMDKIAKQWTDYIEDFINQS